MAVALLIIAIIAAFKAGIIGTLLSGNINHVQFFPVQAWWLQAVIGFLFAVFGLTTPIILKPFEKAWMALSHVMGIVVTTILLTITFTLVITPVGLLMRLFGNDPMKRKPGSADESYWIDVDRDGSSQRPDKPY